MCQCLNRYMISLMVSCLNIVNLSLICLACVWFHILDTFLHLKLGIKSLVYCIHLPYKQINIYELIIIIMYGSLNKTNKVLPSGYHQGRVVYSGQWCECGTVYYLMTVECVSGPGQCQASVAFHPSCCKHINTMWFCYKVCYYCELSTFVWKAELKFLLRVACRITTFQNV